MCKSGSKRKLGWKKYVKRSILRITYIIWINIEKIRIWN